MQYYSCLLFSKSVIIQMSNMDHKWIKETNKIKNVAIAIATVKWNYGGHIARSKESRWANAILYQRPYIGTTERGKPPIRWTNDLKPTAELVKRIPEQNDME